MCGGCARGPPHSGASRRLPPGKLRGERMQIALAVLTFVCLAAEWITHPMMHHPHHYGFGAGPLKLPRAVRFAPGAAFASSAPIRSCSRSL